VQQRGTTAASFDTPAIAADLTMEETVEGSSLEQSYVEEGSEERYYEEEQEGGEEHHESVEDERPQGSLEVSTRSFRSRLPSVELSLVAEEEEEASFVRERSREPEQAEEESKDDLMEESTAEEQSADEDGQDDGVRLSASTSSSYLTDLTLSLPSRSYRVKLSSSSSVVADLTTLPPQRSIIPRLPPPPTPLPPRLRTTLNLPRIITTSTPASSSQTTTTREERKASSPSFIQQTTSPTIISTRSTPLQAQ
jgi:hypothetical protein